VKVGIVASALLLDCVCAHAGTVMEATITRLEAEAKGLFTFYLSAPIAGSPACASQPATAFVVDGTSDGGNVIVALISMAYTLRQPVRASGNNTCSLHVGIGTLSKSSTVVQPTP
jgi:hypothetical protein